MPMSSAWRDHPVDGQQRLARQPPATERGGGERRRPREEEQDDDSLHRPLDARQALRRDDHLAAPEPAHRHRHGPEALSGISQAEREELPSAREGAGANARRDHLPRRDPVAVGEQHATVGVEHLRRGPAAGQRGLRHLEELVGPMRRVAARDRGHPLADVAIDRGLQVRSQPHDQERTERDHDHREHGRVPDRQAGADREAHSDSSMKPTPRIVRISCRPDGSSSFRRR